jgi:hypothetical protein
MELNAQLAIFPEFISFLSGHKKILRIVLDSSETKLNLCFFEEFNFFVKQTDLYETLPKNYYSCIVSRGEAKAFNNLKPITMLSISRSLDLLNEFEDAELSGDTTLAGKHLGYPKCCVDNLCNINEYGTNWALYYLSDFQNQKKASLYCNRFPVVNGGISVVGELFPCSLNCDAAIQYSFRMLEDLENYGFKKIKETILKHCKEPVFINKHDGRISGKEEAGFHKLVFT